MSKLIYVDTNVYLDLFEDRQDKFRSFGEVSRQLFRRALGCEFNIVVSSVVVDEIKYNGYYKDFLVLFDDLKDKNKIIYTEETYKDRVYADELKNLRRTPFKDTCHTVIAARMKAEVLITRNLKDFQNFLDIIEIISPDFI